MLAGPRAGSGACFLVLACCGGVVMHTHVWAHVVCHMPTHCRVVMSAHGTLKRLTCLRAALLGKERALVGEPAMLPLPNKRIHAQLLEIFLWGLMHSGSWVHSFFGGVVPLRHGVAQTAWEAHDTNMGGTLPTERHASSQSARQAVARLGCGGRAEKE